MHTVLLLLCWFCCICICLLKGNAYTANDNVLYGEEGFEVFMVEAFTFRLQPLKKNVLSGTFAKNPVTVFVRLLLK